MGTVEAPEETNVEGVIQRLGLRAAVIRSAAADTAYGSTKAAGHRLYPLVLVLTAVLAAGFSTPQPTDVVLFFALTLLAVWIGGHK